MHSFVYTHDIHVHMFVYTCMYTYMFVYTYVLVHVHMSMYVRIHIRVLMHLVLVFHQQMPAVSTMVLHVHRLSLCTQFFGAP